MLGKLTIAARQSGTLMQSKEVAHPMAGFSAVRGKSMELPPLPLSMLRRQLQDSYPVQVIDDRQIQRLARSSPSLGARAAQRHAAAGSTPVSRTVLG
ncbi:MAG: hypothetical protein ACREB5_04850, partial [Sphingomonadaceae bacterium]